MSFFKKIFNIPSKEKKIIQEQEVTLSLDDLFVHNFIEKGGKFLYCASEKEVKDSIGKILIENNWQKLSIIDNSLIPFLDNSNVTIEHQLKNADPFFTKCEHLIASNGAVLFSSNQLYSHKLSALPNNFIVFAKTSQFVKDTGEGLTGIKQNNSTELPTNISSIKYYKLEENTDNFLIQGNNNTKNLYLLLLEDL